MLTASEEWKRVIDAGTGYFDLEPSVYHDLLEKTKKYNLLFRTLCRYAFPSSKVLEAGCGWAFPSFALAERGVSVVALDISEKLIEGLRKIQGEMSGSVRSHLHLVVGDIFRLSELRQTFDVVYNDGTYEHFLMPDERKEILRNIWDRLSSKGKYVVAVPNLRNLFFHWMVEPKMPSMQSFTFETLTDELEVGGFRVIERGYHFVDAGFEQWLRAKWMAAPVWWANGIFPALPLLFQKRMAAHIYCVAEKVPKLGPAHDTRD